jgi:hypothetical protein
MNLYFREVNKVIIKHLIFLATKIIYELLNKAEEIFRFLPLFIYKKNKHK